MYGIAVVIRRAVDGQCAAVEVLVLVDAAPAHSAAEVLHVGQLDRGTIRKTHDRIDPVGVVGVIAVTAVGHHQGQLSAAFGNVHLYIRGIARGQIRDGAAAVERVLRVDELRAAGVEKGHELVAVGGVVGSPHDAVVHPAHLTVIG